MRKFKMVYPAIDDNQELRHVEEIVTEKDIMENYYPTWSYLVQLKHGDNIPLDKERCIEDFCTVHWAWEV